MNNEEDIQRTKTPAELNDGLDPQEEHRLYQGPKITKDGVYLGTYGFFIWSFLIIGTIVYMIWQFVPRQYASYIGLEWFFNFMPDQYWTLVFPSIFVLGFFCVVVGQLGIMNWYTVHPASPYAYTDKKRTEVTKPMELTTESIPPIEDCDIVDVSRLLYA